jgi:hypothetical protein
MRSRERFLLAAVLFLAASRLLTPLGRGSDSKARLRFTDIAPEAGVTLHNVCGDPQNKLAIPESLGQGAAAIDYDADGRLDLFLANGDVLEGTKLRAEPRPALYRNEGGNRFTDVTREAGLLFRAWFHGATAADFDDDGLTDLYLTVYFGPNRFFRNRGDGTFEDFSARWGGADPGPSTAAAFFDAEGDGDLDLYVANYVVYDPKNPPNQGRPCRWHVFDVFCGPWGTEAAPDTFYENREGRLAQASEAFGFASVRPAYGLGAVTGDFDDDGDVDLYVANDSVANFLWENRGGRFREVALEHGVDRREDGQAQAGMGVDFGDVDNDGRFDYFVTNFANDTNTLYHQLAGAGGRRVFLEATHAMRLGAPSYPMMSWGTRIVDLDRDGWQDIVVASGHIYPPADQVGLGTSYAQVNQVFRNQGRGPGGGVTFEEVSWEPSEAFSKKSVSRGLLTADLDDDGDQDILIVEMDGPPTLLRNDSEGAGHWIGFELVGELGNRDGIGARLSVEDASGNLRFRERTSGGSYLSSSDPRLFFGLGGSGGRVKKVVVRWPSGGRQTFEGLDTDRYWRLDARSDAAAPWGPETRQGR